MPAAPARQLATDNHRSLIRQVLAALVVGPVSSAVAAIFAVLLAAALFLGEIGWYNSISSWGPLAGPLAVLATGLVVCASLFVLFGTAARISAWLRIPRWHGIVAAGIFGGAGLHWLLLYLTFLNKLGFDVTFPYWWRDVEIRFG